MTLRIGASKVVQIGEGGRLGAPQEDKKTDKIRSNCMTLMTRAFRFVIIGVWALKGERNWKIVKLKKYFPFKPKAITDFRVLSTCVV